MRAEKILESHKLGLGQVFSNLGNILQRVNFAPDDHIKEYHFNDFKDINFPLNLLLS